MSRRRGCWSLLAATALIAGAAWLAVGRAPRASTLWHQEGVQRLHAVAPPDSQHPPRAWRMQLRLDPALKAPGPAWAMSEGRGGSAGYELVWQSETSTLVLHRGGDAPRLLGWTRLARQPRQVVLARRGARLQALVDGRLVLACLDPDEDRLHLHGDASGWTFHASSEMGASSLTIENDAGLTAVDGSDVGDAASLDADPGTWQSAGFRMRLAPAPPWKPSRPDHALLSVRRCLAAGVDPDALLLLGQAVAAVAALPTSHPDHATLNLWLAYAEARLAVALVGQDHAAPDADGSRFDPGWPEQAIANLIGAAASNNSPEGPGLLLALVPDLARLALARAPVPKPIATVLDRRDRWLRLLESTARAIPDLPPDLQPQVDLLAHACGCLMRLDPAALHPDARPLAADAPPWVAVRWRALAGAPFDGTALPPWPSGAFIRDPVQDVVDRLVAAAGLDPLPLVIATTKLREDLDAPIDLADADAKAVLGLLTDLRRHELARAGRRSDEAQAIAERIRVRLGDDAGFSNASPLVCNNPRAFALAQLARVRLNPGRQRPEFALPGAASDRPDADIIRDEAFAQLKPFAFLLGGSADSTTLVWLHADHVLPPARALAAALAMQEVRGQAAVPWSLLYRVPCLSLPLEFLVPEASHEPSTPTRPVIPLP